jgi:LacI family transcriptional regulator
MKSRKTVRNVAVTYPATVPWMALFLRGVADYAERRGGWSLTISPPTLSWAGEQPLTLADLQGMPIDGVIAAIGDRAEARAARRLRKPVVNIAATAIDLRFPRVLADHYGMGRLAADHLLERGLRHLAYFGFEEFRFSQLRRQGFVDRAKEAGIACEVLEVPGHPHRPRTWRQRIGPLTRWLRKLPTPIGLLAVQDYRARAAIDECRRLGLGIPGDVAIIGIDDDPTICEFCRPTLSSVSRNSWRLGYETASLLDDLMSGRTPPNEEILVPSDGIVARQSTDTVVVDDLQVAAAVRFIHDRSGEVFGVEQVTRATAISRRLLETRFRRALGCTIHDYICRRRLERAKELLSVPERTKLHRIVKACGFSSIEQMRLVFKRMTGLTPLEHHRTNVLNRDKNP